MLTADNALWILTVLLFLLAAWGLVWFLGREHPTDSDAPARDRDNADEAYNDIAAMLPDHTGRGGPR